MLEAFEIELAFESRVLIREFLVEIGVKLAFFQPGLGALAIRLSDPVSQDRGMIGKGNQSAAHIDIFEVLARQRQQINRFDALYEACLHERGLLMNLLSRAALDGGRFRRRRARSG